MGLLGWLRRGRRRRRAPLFSDIERKLALLRLDRLRLKRDVLQQLAGNPETLRWTVAAGYPRLFQALDPLRSDHPLHTLLAEVASNHHREKSQLERLRFLSDLAAGKPVVRDMRERPR